MITRKRVVCFRSSLYRGGWKGQKQIYTHCLSGWKSVDNVPKLVTDYMSKKIKVDEFVTHTLPFDKINEAFELMHTGKR